MDDFLPPAYGMSAGPVMTRGEAIAMFIDGHSNGHKRLSATGEHSAALGLRLVQQSRPG